MVIIVHLNEPVTGNAPLLFSMIHCQQHQFILMYSFICKTAENQVHVLSNRKAITIQMFSSYWVSASQLPCN